MQVVKDRPSGRRKVQVIKDRPSGRRKVLTIASTCLAYCHGYVLRRYAPGTNRANYGSQVKRMLRLQKLHREINQTVL